MRTRARPSKHAVAAFWCGASAAQHWPGVDVIIRVFDYMPDELMLEHQRAAYAAMPNSEWWRHFWQGFREGTRMRNGEV
jgi:hypothetical protein